MLVLEDDLRVAECLVHLKFLTLGHCARVVAVHRLRADIKLLLLAEGVPAQALSKLPRSMQWPPKEHADLPSELTE